jgi:hypothetical protein
MIKGLTLVVATACASALLVAGADHFVWNGRIGGHQLAPGRYRPIATASGGSVLSVDFRIID